MRKLFLSAMALTAIVCGMSFTSCSDDENATDPNPDGNNPPTTEEAENLPGEIREDLTLEPGTTLYGVDNVCVGTAYLSSKNAVSTDTVYITERITGEL